MYGTWTSWPQRQAALLAELPADLILGPVASTIQTELAVQRKQATDAMLEALNSERYRKLVGLIAPLAERSAVHRCRRLHHLTRSTPPSRRREKKASKRPQHGGCGAARRRAFR